MGWLTDLTKLGLVVAIVAILLAIPLSVLANLLTPRIQNWWSQRSAKSLRSRIHKLQQELAEYQPYALIDEASAYTLWGIFMISTMCLLLIRLLAAVAFMVLMIGTHSEKINIPVLISLVVMLGSIELFAYGLKKTFFKELNEFRWRHSPVRREDISNDIRKLQEKLAKMTL
jgi:hypothetical protein